MPDNIKSPAVISMETEQARQRNAEAKGDLEAGLEDTFPASDPVSMVSSGVPAGRADVKEAVRVHRSEDAYTTEPAATTSGDGGRLLANVEALIRENPWTALGAVAMIAFVWGATR